MGEDVIRTDDDLKIILDMLLEYAEKLEGSMRHLSLHTDRLNIGINLLFGFIMVVIVVSMITLSLFANDNTYKWYVLSGDVLLGVSLGFTVRRLIVARRDKFFTGAMVTRTARQLARLVRLASQVEDKSSLGLTARLALSLRLAQAESILLMVKEEGLADSKSESE